MSDDTEDAVTALYRLAAAQIELADALTRLTATCEGAAAAIRASAPGPHPLHPDLAGHPDLVELDARLGALDPEEPADPARGDD